MLRRVRLVPRRALGASHYLLALAVALRLLLVPAALHLHLLSQLSRVPGGQHVPQLRIRLLPLLRRSKLDALRVVGQACSQGKR